MRFMPRIHFFEFEDLPWFPHILRNYMTDFLQAVSHLFDVYEPIIPIIEKGLAKSKTNVIIDLASGGGGGWKKISSTLKETYGDHKILLTDLYPNLDSLDSLANQSSYMEVCRGSVDARCVPKLLNGLRTQFLSLHHFHEEDVQSIFQNTVDDEQVLAVFEITERSLKGVLSIMFIPITTLLITPMITPFSIFRLVLTYILPILPFLILWDGMVSVFRTYSEKELRSIIEKVKGSENYVWEIGKKTKGPGQVFYLLAYPK